MRVTVRLWELTESFIVKFFTSILYVLQVLFRAGRGGRVPPEQVRIRGRQEPDGRRRGRGVVHTGAQVLGGSRVRGDPSGVVFREGQGSPSRKGRVARPSTTPVRTTVEGPLRYESRVPRSGSVTEGVVSRRRPRWVRWRTVVVCTKESNPVGPRDTCHTEGHRGTPSLPVAKRSVFLTQSPSPEVIPGASVLH